MNTENDPSAATKVHIVRVRKYLGGVADELNQRGFVHDASKLQEPEVSLFNNASSVLHGLTYGSPEYKKQIKEVLGPAVKHHYEHNTHHPEHWDHRRPDGEWFGYGIRRMSLLDLLEMLADWKAAGERHADGSLFQSLKLNRERFKIPNDLFFVLCKTAFELGWLTQVECMTLSIDFTPMEDNLPVNSNDHQ